MLAADTTKLVPKRVLVVEDDDGVREAITQLLLDEMFLPVCASNGREALARLNDDEVLPGLIVLDLMMPDMNGPDFAAALHADPRFSDLPIVVVSADRDINEVSKAIGATASLAKPFHIEQFHEIVRAAYRTREPARIEVTPKKALLIDDTEVSLKETAAVLRSAGLDVGASLGLVGVGRALLREAPDIVVIGRSMPVVFHRRLVALLRERGARCVLLSGDGTAAEMERDVRDAGADGYVPTRGTPEAVAHAIRDAYLTRH